MQEPPRDFTAFLESATRVGAPPLCPDIRLHLAENLDALWAGQERWLGRAGLPPPFWGVAWPGGQALARYVLDDPDSVRGRAVLDLGSGCGLVAIAAARSGARAVEAADTDAFARSAIRANAGLNGVTLATPEADLVGTSPRWDVVLAADLWYERFLAGRLTAWLREIAAGGTPVLLGDNGRAFFPKQGVEELRRFELGSATPERAPVTTAGVWRLRP